MLRWAILGTSFISHTVADAITRSPGSTMTSVFGRDPERLDRFRAAYDIETAHTTIEEAVDDPSVDAVYIGLPNHLHHEAVAVAAAAGKAILSEKSLAVTLQQSNAIADAVRGKVFFVEGLMYLSHPLMARYVEVLSDGRLGRLTAIHATYAADIAAVVNPLGGGAVFDLGCYPASLAQLTIDALHGESSFAACDVVALGRTGDPRTRNHGTIEETAATLRFASDVTATLHTAESYGMHSHFEVCGTNGSIRFESNPWLPPAGASRFVWTPYDAAAGTDHAAPAETFTVTSELDAFDHQLRMVERCVAARVLEAERPSPRLRDSLELMGVLVRWNATALKAANRSDTAVSDASS